MTYRYREPEPDSSMDCCSRHEEDGIVIRHGKDGLYIYINIYNTNNNANEDSEAGLKQKAETGGQITGECGSNANQGGQIAGKCGQNANQDSQVCPQDCEGCAEGFEGGDTGEY